jgi:hypothetical protein
LKRATRRARPAIGGFIKFAEAEPPLAGDQRRLVGKAVRGTAQDFTGQHLHPHVQKLLFYTQTI